MSTEIINKRTTDPDDSERLARRRSIREQAARRDLELQPAVLAEADVKASERRCDELAEQHAMATAPWQSELSALEERAIARIGQRKPVNSEEDERRAELTKLISSATADLERAIAAEREIQAVARQKARRIRQGHPPSDTILAALAKPPLASPRLLAEQHVARERAKWLRVRQQAAEKSLRIQTYNATEIRADRMSGDLDAVLARVAAWEAELSAVTEEMTAALAEGEKIHQRLIDE
ncbi:MAG: hypothetical protein JXB10_01455 [Pirellulales bacterium]|nr:hypothetical protein [Pirellulales bacterium]